jgi:hypothetical protein
MATARQRALSACGIDRCLPAMEKETVEMDYTEFHDGIDVAVLLTTKQGAV